MHTDTSSGAKHIGLPPLSLPSATRDAKSSERWESVFGHWDRLQLAFLVSGVVLVSLLAFQPSIGLDVLWNVLIPIAPALIVVAPGLWRNICPMATLSLLPHRLGISRRATPSRRTAAILGVGSLAALLLIVPYRHLSLNTNGPMSALMLIAAGGIAFWMGVVFKLRSGWCTSLCPIHPVERLYGLAPALTFRNARCVVCERCSTPCPDSTHAMTPAITAPSAVAAIAGHAMIGGFAGFIWGWYQIPDYHGPVTATHFVRAYLWPFGGALVSLAVYTVLYHFGTATKAARNMRIRVFSATAISTYYWYRIPALFGLGIHPGTGMLFDLTLVLPPWFEHLSHGATTLFFFWFMVVRPNPRASWMERPPLRQVGS